MLGESPCIQFKLFLHLWLYIYKQIFLVNYLKLKHLFVLVIEAEKEQQQLIAGIENFDPAKLKPTVTEEKNPLPTKEGT